MQEDTDDKTGNNLKVRETFICQDQVYELIMTDTDDTLELTLLIDETGKAYLTYIHKMINYCLCCLFLDIVDDCERRHPKTVVAFLDGQIRIMKEYSLGCWGPVKWANTYKVNETKPPYHYESKFPVFHIVLDFNHPSSEPSSDGEQQVLSNLSKLLEDQSTADVIFIVKEKKIPAHSAIVASASPVLAALIEQATLENAPVKTVEIADVEPEIFQQLIRFCYTGAAPLLRKLEFTEPLFLAAVKYQMEPLKDDCEISLSETLSVATAMRRITMAHVNSASKLLDAAIKLLVKHKEDVWNFPEWKNLATNHLDLFLLLIHRMVADQHCGDCKLKSATK